MDQSEKSLAKTILMVTWGILQAIGVPLVIFGVMTVHRLDNAIAELRPVILQLQSSSAQIVGKATYDKDQTMHIAEHTKLDLSINKQAMELQKLQLDIVRLDIRFQQRLQDVKVESK